MDSAHPLLIRAHRYARHEADLHPAGCSYDDIAGAWRDDATGELAVEMPVGQGPHSKKMDVETGEDQKGE
jgi:hypothetical protein